MNTIEVGWEGLIGYKTLCEAKRKRDILMIINICNDVTIVMIVVNSNFQFSSNIFKLIIIMNNFKYNDI